LEQELADGKSIEVFQAELVSTCIFRGIHLNFKNIYLTYYFCFKGGSQAGATAIANVFGDDQGGGAAEPQSFSPTRHLPLHC
jgi:hypothetical protein